MADPGRNTLLADEWPYSPKFQEFATFLGVPASKDSKGIDWRHDKKTADKIEKIYAWGKLKSQSEDPIDIMIMVKQAIRDLGITFRGKTLVDHLFGFVTLDTKTIILEDQKEKIEKEKQLYQYPIPKEENGDTREP